MEENEISRLREHLVHSAIHLSSMDEHTAIKTVNHLLESLSEDKGATITFSNFVDIGKNNSVLLGLLIPDSMMDIKFSLDPYNNQAQMQIDEPTLELFNMLEVGPYDKSHAKALLLDVEPKATDLNKNTLLHSGAKANAVKVVQEVLNKTGNSLVNMTNNRGATPLMIAAERGNSDVVGLLLAAGADVNIQDQEGGTALHRALREKEQIRGAGLAVSINRILDAKPNLGLMTRHKNSPLCFAARYNQPEHIPRLLQMGADVNFRSYSDHTPLIWAAQSGNVACMSKLLAGGADPHATTTTGITALHAAAGAGSLNSLELLKEHKPDFMKLDQIGRTPLHHAAANGNVRCVKFLILNAPDALKVIDNAGQSALQIAQLKGHQEAAKVIEGGPLQEQSEFSIQLLKLFRKGENDTVKKMLKKKEADVHVANENGTTLVHYSAMQGRDDILSFLLERGANPNIGNNRLTRPLHKAVQRGEVKCTKILLDGGADPNVQDEDGITPLHRGLNELQLGKKVTKITAAILELLSHKPKLNLPDNQGRLPLDIVAENGYVGFLEPFVQAGAQLDLRNPKSGWTPLVHAVAGGQVEMIEKLLSMGVKLDPDDILPISVAIQFRHTNILPLLMRHGAKLAPACMHTAAQTGNKTLAEEILKYLLELQFPLSEITNCRDSDENTPLHHAKGAEMVMFLVENEASPDLLNKFGQTPLLFYCDHNYDHQTIAAIVLTGAELDVKDKNQMDALKLCALRRNDAAVRFLRGRGLQFELKNAPELEMTEGPLYPRIKKGTMEGLINHLMCHDYTDEEFMNTFFATYHMFSKPSKLWRRIKSSYKHKRPTTETTGSVDYLPSPGPIAVLYHWVRFFFQDFEKDSELATKAFEFVKKLSVAHKPLQVMFSEKMETLAVRQELTMPSSRRGSLTTPSEPTSTPTTYEPFASPSVRKFGGLGSLLTKGLEILSEKGSNNPQTWFVDKKLSLIKIPSALFAQQVAVHFSQLLRGISMTECVNFSMQASIMKQMDYSNLLPGIWKANVQANLLSRWLADQILLEKSKKDRAKVIFKMIDVLQEAIKLHDLLGAWIFLETLTSPAISRLYQTWELVGKNQMLLAFLPLLSKDNDYGSYRNLLAGIHTACNPILSVHLDRMADRVPVEPQDPEDESKIILFHKNYEFTEELLIIKRCQEMPYPINEDSLLGPWLSNPWPAPTAKLLMDASLKAEPRK